MVTYFKRNLTSGVKEEIEEKDINNVDINEYTIEMYEEDGKKSNAFIGKEFERNKQIFFETHMKWGRYLKSKCWKRKRKVADDIIQDFLIWFMDFHCKFFDYNYKDPRCPSVENRAKNYYIKRFNYFIDNDSHSAKKVEKLYNISHNESDIDVDSYIGGTFNKNENNEGNTVKIKNLDNNESHVQPGANTNRYCLNLEGKIYFEGLTYFIENNVEDLYAPTKEKILGFLNEFIKTGEVNIKSNFGTTTTYYRNLIGTFIKEYDHVYGEPEVEKIKNVRYKIVYS